MNAHDKLERQLRASVAQIAGRRPGYRTWPWSGGVSALIIAASAAVTVGVAAVALVALRHSAPAPPSHSIAPATTSPRSRFGRPPKQPARARNVFAVAGGQALNTAAREDPACGQPPGGPIETRATPSASLLSTLPALRRPATSADRLPNIRYPHSWLGHLHVDVYIRFVRRARVAYGTSYYLVPAARVGLTPLSPAAANHCYQLEVAALKADLPTLPRAKRAPTLRYEEAEFAITRYRAETSSLHEGVYLYAQYKIPYCTIRSAIGGGTWSCGEAGGGGQSPAAIRQAGTLDAGRLGPPGSPWIVSGIVPAGVASVTIDYPANRHAGRRLPALNATGDVVNNIFAIQVPTLEQRGWRPATATWRSANGRVIKTIKER